MAGIPAYVAGRPAPPPHGRPTYKLSSNENPYPPLPAVLELVQVALGQMNRYPDMGNHDLYEALAGKLGVDEERLAAATGSVALIYQLVQAFCDPGDEVVYAWRSFEAFPIAVAAGAAASVRVPVAADGRHDLAAMAEAVTERTRVVFVCTPNNPTGPAVTHRELAAFLATVPERVLVVIDEAYREFVRMDDPVDGLALAAAHQNVVLARTFSKAHGLAGLRVGYAVAAPPIATALRAVSLPFGVSGVAQAAAVASLEHEPALLARVGGAGRGAGPRGGGSARRRLGRPRAPGQLRVVRPRRTDARLRCGCGAGGTHGPRLRRRGLSGGHRRAGGQRPAHRVRGDLALSGRRSVSRPRTPA